MSDTQTNICDLHNVLVPKGYPCPACQRTPDETIKIWRQLKRLDEKLDSIYKLLEKR